MNFYTLIFKKNIISAKRWFIRVLVSVFFLSVLIIVINYIVDPYNITKYNLMNIKYKFARDDRTEKVRYFKTLEKFDNIMIGSSRVYSINPIVVSTLIGGTTYNFGVGTATIEDHLGIIKYLARENKLPKVLIIGVDFYTFNPKIPPNKYFLKNKELNFLSYDNYEEDYIAKFYSIDSLRASFKTLKNHFSNSNQRARFNHLGWGAAYEDYKERDLNSDLVAAKKELQENIQDFLTNLNYNHIDKTRVNYYEQIKAICKKHEIELYIFNTPLHPILLDVLENNSQTQKALNEFISYLSTFKNFTNLYREKEIYSDMRNFRGTTHTSTNAGDLILEKVLKHNIKELSFY